MTGEQNIAGLLDTAMEKLNGMVQVNTVVGAPIFAGDTTIIPISKVSLGFVAGGGEYGQKTQPTADPAFGGGSACRLYWPRQTPLRRLARWRQW